ncbi:MAG: hypothetical protein ACRDB0_04995 [Paraclostridium sp.]
MSKKQLYNLQIPIERELEAQLRFLANEDDRALRTFCKRVLKQYAKEHAANITVESVTPVAPVVNEVIEVIEEPTIKKKKVGMLRPNNL